MTGKDETDFPQGTPARSEDGMLDNRLEKLDTELEKLRTVRVEEQQRQQARMNTPGIALAWRLGSEFISGVLVGSAVGWMLDTWLGWSPWGLIIFMLLGFLAGMLNMLRAAGKLPPPGEKE